jgi:hypothetical protein
VLFVFFVHGVVWQVVHVHDGDHFVENESHSVNHTETVIEACGHRHNHQGECVLCQLHQQQFLSAALAGSARISPLIESKTASVAVFSAQKSYRSTAVASNSGRGPPRLFLS